MPEPSPASTAAADFKYWAFISYSHRDESWAAWLHRAIETYRVPRPLVGRSVNGAVTPRRLFPVFRDRDELPGAADLGAKINEALRQSRFQIVICSPASANSRWVNEEICRFKALGREDRVLCLVVDGEPNASDRPERGLQECFPPAVRFRVGPNGDLATDRAEPLAADARVGKDGKANAVLKLLAGILGVGFDDLRQREARRRARRRSLWAAGTALAISLVCVGYIGLADWSGERTSLPFAPAIKAFLDRHELTVFRPVRSDTEVPRAAAELRRALVESLSQFLREQAANTAEPKPQFSVWLTTQVVSALLRAPETTTSGRLNAIQALALPFTPGLAIEAKGVKYGWLPSGSPATMAEPALWTTIALSLAYSHRALLNDQQIREVQEHLIYAQEATRIYRPLADGGWNTFPNQDNPGQHSTYTTSLALLALLEARAAGVQWAGDPGRDRLLAAAADWLVRHFEPGAVPGWRVAPGIRNEPNDGLSLYVYRELVWAENDTGFELPESIRTAIFEQLIRLGDRQIDFPSATSGYFSVPYRNHLGQRFNENPGTEFPWLPAAIGCATDNVLIGAHI